MSRIGLAQTLIAEFVIAENERRGIEMSEEAREQIRLDAGTLAVHLDEYGALAD